VKTIFSTTPPVAAEVTRRTCEAIDDPPLNEPRSAGILAGVLPVV